MRDPLQGSVGPALVKVNTTTGATTRVGNSIGYGRNEYNVSAMTSYNNRLVMFGHSRDRIYTLNTSDGTANSGFDISRSTDNVNGLTEFNNTLYGVDSDHHALWVFASQSGVSSGRVGSATNFGVNETHPTGLAVAPGLTF